MDETLQPLPKSTTYFEVLGLPRAMRQDSQTIERAFRETSKRVHPDRFSTASPEQRRIALDYTTFVNDAYRTLRDAQRRAEYLMSLEGVRIGDERSTTRDPELLMEMLELQEKLEHLAAGEPVEKMGAEMAARKKTLLDRLARFFDDHEGTKDAAIAMLEQLRFLERLLERIDTKLEEAS